MSNTAINLNAATFNISDGPGGAFSTMTGPTVLGNKRRTFNTHGVNDNNVHNFGAVDADNAGAQDRTLTVTAFAATAIFSGPVGFSQPLADLDVTAGLIRFNTTSFNVSDGVGVLMATLTGPVELDANVTFNTHGTHDNNVTFTSTINADAAANNRKLIVTAGCAMANFLGNVGGSQLLAETLDPSASATHLQGTTYNINLGATTSTINAAVLNANVAFSMGSNSLTFTGPVISDATANNRTLSVSDAGGTTTFSGDVGAGTNHLANLTVTANSIVLNSPLNPQALNIDAGAAASTSTWTGPVTLGQNATFTMGGNSLQFSVCHLHDQRRIQSGSQFIRHDHVWRGRGCLYGADEPHDRRRWQHRHQRRQHQDHRHANLQ